MNRKYIYLKCLTSLAVCLLAASNCFAEPLQFQRLLKKGPSGYRLSYDTTYITGYNSNVKLTPTSQREADAFEEFLYSLTLTKKLAKGIQFTFDYDLDYLNYNSVSSASNLLNHLGFGLYKKISDFTLGSGYEFDYFYYHRNADGDFFIHTPYVFLRHNLMSGVYHKLLYQFRFKDHASRNALANTISTYQDKTLEDMRQGIEYGIGTNLIKNTLLNFSFKFYVNDSNARYIDYYDYKAYEFTQRVNYRFNKELNIIAQLSYTKRDYKSRLVALGTEEEEDNIFTFTAAARYALGKKDALSLMFIRRENSSNNNIEDYVDNIVTCGWQHYF